ncbi:MAG: hypothetical protein ACJAT7_001882 [Psychromonas sp.]|uniref:hypothetical protein n=1 Tax=Psychromonas sp. TaxID=1884585 RepID=UPI0039E42E03
MHYQYLIKHHFSLYTAPAMKVNALVINPVINIAVLIRGAWTRRHDPKVHASKQAQGFSRKAALFNCANQID